MPRLACILERQFDTDALAGFHERWSLGEGRILNDLRRILRAEGIPQSEPCERMAKVRPDQPERNAVVEDLPEERLRSRIDERPQHRFDVRAGLRVGRVIALAE